MKEESLARGADAPTSKGGWRRGVELVLALLPLAGLVELVAHVKQTRDVVPDSDWRAARDLVRAEARPDDLVVFAPFWADPVGRAFFGAELAGLDRSARPDETRFARAFEVSLRGARREELATFRPLYERRVGRLTVRLLENPAPAKVLVDLVTRLRPEHASVARVEQGQESPCVWQRGAGQPGGLGVPQGPAVPGDKFVCPGGGYVGVAVLHALDHHPHRCIFVSPQSPTSLLRIRFADVQLGAALHGHAGVQWVTERTPTNDRIQLSFSAFERPLGQSFHRVGVGWQLFEFPTPDWAGRRGELVVDVSGAGQRSYCFEADTR